MAFEARRNFTLLFADSFSHEEEDGGKEELHLDLVRFPQPVCIREVRIIPAGYRFHPHLPDHYGQTKPLSFKLDMFVRNLRQPEVSVFERLATMDYTETDFLYVPKLKIVTDMFIVKGWYSSLTVCLYGHVVGRDPSAQSPPADGPSRILSEEPLPHKPGRHLARPESLQEMHLHQQHASRPGQHAPRPGRYHANRPDHHHANHHQQQQQQQNAARPEQVANRESHHAQQQQQQQQRLHEQQQQQQQQQQQTQQQQQQQQQQQHRLHEQRLHEQQRRHHEQQRRHHEQQQQQQRITLLDRPGSLLGMPSMPPVSLADLPIRGPPSEQQQHAMPSLMNMPKGQQQQQQLGVDHQRHEVAPASGSGAYRAPMLPARKVTPVLPGHAAKTEKSASRSQDLQVPSNDLMVTVRGRSPDKPGLTRTIVNVPVKEESAPARKAAAEERASILDDDGADAEVDHLPLPFDEMDEEVIGLVDEAGLAAGHPIDMELFGDDDAWLSVFNPYDDVDLLPLSTLVPCHRTPFEMRLVQLKSSAVSAVAVLPESSLQLLNLVGQMEDVSDPSQWMVVLEKLPAVCDSGLADIVHVDPTSPVLSSLACSTLRALDWSAATSLPLAVNIRQLKAGIRLFLSLVECSSGVAAGLFSAGGLEALCRLLEVDALASSVKIQVLRAVDSAVDFSQGMEHFLGWASPTAANGASVSEQREQQSMSCYRTLVSFLMRQQTARVMQCGRVLLKKAHAYELLGRLQEQVDSVAASASALKVDEGMHWQEERQDELAPPHGTRGLSADERTTDEVMDTGGGGGDNAAKWKLEQKVRYNDEQKTASDAGLASLSQDEYNDEETAELALNEEMALELANFAVASLGKLLVIFRTADENLTQLPPKVCPTKCRLVEFSAKRPWPALFRWCNSRRLLDILLVMLSSPQLSSHSEIFSLIRDILLCFLDTESGLVYLAENYTTLNEIIRVLSQASDTDIHVSRLLTLQDVLHNPESCTSQNLGMLLLYHLQTLTIIDVLAGKAAQAGDELDTPATLSALHQLYTIVFTPIGKFACSHVLSLGDNLASLLAFALPSGDEAKDSKLSASVACGYVRHLLLVVLQTSEHKQYLCSNGEKLLKIADAAGRLQEGLKAWLEPVRCVQDPAADHAAALVNLVQSSVNDLSSVNLANLPTIVTALRLLQHLCCPPADSSTASKDELCWKSGCLSLLSANAVEVLLATGQKLCTIQEPLWLQGHLLSHPSNSHFLSAACSLLAVLVELMRQLGTTQAIQFSDIRVVNVVVQLHSIMCAQPVNICTAAQQVQVLAVQILATFTKLPSGQVAGAESSEKSPWYMMLDALLTFIEKVPQNFIGGLVLLSELFPLPLPISGAVPSAVKESLAQRQLWSAQLNLHSDRLRQLISNLSDTSCGALALQLRRVCCQLADVDSSMALVVVRPLLDVLLLQQQPQQSQPQQQPQPQQQHPQQPSWSSAAAQPSSRVLAPLAFLLSQPSVKAAALYALRVDLASPMIINSLTAQLSNMSNNGDISQLAVSILQALLDPLTLTSNTTAKLSPQQLANSLPPVDITLQILTRLQEHLTGQQASYATVLSILRLHAMWVQHEPLLAILYSRSGPLRAALAVVLQRLCSAFGQDSSPTSDEMSTLSTLLELLHLLCNNPSTASSDSDDDDDVSTTAAASFIKGASGKSSAMSFVAVARLCRLLDWSDAPDHPLRQLAATLSGNSQEENGFGGFLEALQLVVEQLDQISPEHVAALPAELGSSEIMLPASQPLGEIFRECAVLTSLSQEDDNSQFLDDWEMWLHPLLTEDAETEPDWVELDLLDLVKRYCGDWSLQNEVKNCLDSTPADSAEAAKRSRLMKRKFDPLISRMRNRTQPVPLRGRGRMLTQRLQRSDMFRGRKNSSRAPSMHVDDFMVLEGDTQPSGQQQQQQQQRMQRGGSGMGRGGGQGRGGMRQGDFGGFGGRGGGHGNSMMPPPPWSHGNQQRMNPRMHNNRDIRQPVLIGNNGPPANRITQELQRILNNLPSSPGVNRWAGDGPGNVPPAGPWQTMNRQSNYAQKSWSTTSHAGSSQMGHPKRQDWPGHGRKLSMDGSGGSGGSGYTGNMPRSDRGRPPLLGGARHDSRHQRTFTR